MIEQLKIRWKISGNPPETHRKPAGNQVGAQSGGFPAQKTKLVVFPAPQKVSLGLETPLIWSFLLAVSGYSINGQHGMYILFHTA